MHSLALPIAVLSALLLGACFAMLWPRLKPRDDGQPVKPTAPGLTVQQIQARQELRAESYDRTATPRRASVDRPGRERITPAEYLERQAAQARRAAQEQARQDEPSYLLNPVHPLSPLNPANQQSQAPAFDPTGSRYLQHERPTEVREGGSW